MSELALKLIEKAIEEKPTFLDLGFCGLKSIPKEITNLPSSITHLNLGPEFFFKSNDPEYSPNELEENDFGDNIASLDFLKYLPNLNILEMHYCNIGNMGLERLKNLTNLRCLNICENEIGDEGAVYLKIFSELNSLNISGNKLSHIGVQSLKHLSNLTFLSLSASEIGDSGLETIGCLSNLRYLDISANDITAKKLRNIGKLTQLTYLDLSLNEIYGGLKDLKGLTDLLHLEIGMNSLGYKDIEGLVPFRKLDFLGLAGNNLGDKGVEGLKEFSELTFLNLSQNNIGAKGLQNLNGLNNLTELNISHNKIFFNKVESINGLNNLKYLDISANQINNYGVESLKNLRFLRNLRISFNNISDEGMKSINSFSQLVHLDISYNNIGLNGIKNITGLTALEHLNLSSSLLGDKGVEGLKAFPQLTSLSVATSQIGDKGAETIGKLSQLASLDIGYNKISDKGAKSLCALINLRYLDIQLNKITHTSHFKDLPLLTYLSLNRNPIKDAPESIVQEYSSIDNLRIWWKETEDSTKVSPNKLTKLQVLGNGNAGKSSVIDAIRNGVCKKEYKSTHGIVIEPLQYKVEDEEVNFQVWDFGGQEIYHGTHKLFISSQSINLIVGDDESEEYALKRQRIPDRENPDELVLHQPLQHYINISTRQSWNSLRVIVKNKIDKFNSATNRNLSKISKENKIRYIEASATKGIGIEKLRKELASIRKEILYYDMLMPISWLNVRQHFIDNLNKKEIVRIKLIDFEQFNEICRINQVSDYAKSALLDYLHQTGIIYKNKEKLNEIIIADQKWALEAIYKALDRRSTFYNELRSNFKGKVQVKNLFYAFGSGYEIEHKWLFLNFMNSCGLCFPFYQKGGTETEDSYYIFPEFLPSEETLPAKEIWKKANEIKVFTYTPDYLDYYRIQKIIVDLGNKTKVEYIWKTGIIVDSNKGMFRVEFANNSSTIKVSIEVSAIDYYLLLIIKTIKESDILESAFWHLENGEVLDIPSLYKRSNNSIRDMYEEERDLRYERGFNNLSSSLPDLEQPALKRIVISYASEDLEAVKDLEETLAPFDGRIQFLYDKRVVDGRSTYNPQISQMFENADCYIVLVSRKYQNKEVKDYIWKNEFPIIKRRNDEHGIPIYCIPVAPVIYNNDIGPLSCFRKGDDPLPEKGHKRDLYLLSFVKEMIEQHFLNMK